MTFLVLTTCSVSHSSALLKCCHVTDYMAIVKSYYNHPLFTDREIEMQQSRALTMVPQTIIIICSNYNYLEDVISIGIVLRQLISAFEFLYLYNYVLQKL